MQLEIYIETYYDIDGKRVWIGDEDGSGCNYPYKTTDELVEIVGNYVKEQLTEEE